MYLTHHFAHRDTLDRARNWLAHLGFRPGELEVYVDGIPRITLNVALTRAAAVQMVLHAIESSDPDGWPGMLDLARRDRTHPELEDARLAGAGTDGRVATVIGWHPLEDVPAVEPSWDEIRDALSH